MRSRAWLAGLAVLGVLLLAAGFRFYDIKDYPPGLFPDEAANGEDLLLILDGDLRPFYPRGNGREALFFYLQALSVWLFGIGVWQMHIVSGVVGFATVAAMYFAGRVWFGRLAGFLSALFLATSHWHVTLSRTGFRAIMIPLFVALFTAWVGYTIAALRQGRKWQSYLYAALAGAALAGGFYTYIAFRVMIGVVGGIVVLLLLAALHPKIGFPHFRRYGVQLAVGAVACVLVLAPLAIYFVQHPADFVGRAGQVSVFNPDLQREFGGASLAGTILYSLRQTLLSFFTGAGDLNWRHNVAGFALLNPLVALLFLLGLFWALRGSWWAVLQIVRGQEVHLGMIYPYLLLLLAGMLLPVISTAEGMPHGLRSLGLLFPIFLLAGTAGAVIVHWLRRLPAGPPAGRTGKQGVSLQSAQYLRAILMGAIAGMIVTTTVYDGALYFGISRNDAGAHYAYRGDLPVLVEYVKEYGSEGAKPYLVLDDFSLQTPHYLLSVAAHDFRDHPDAEQHRYRAVKPEESHLVELQPGEVIIFTQSTLPDADRFAAAHPLAEQIISRRNRFNQEIMRVYRASGAAAGAVEGAQDAARGEHYDLDAQ